MYTPAGKVVCSAAGRGKNRTETSGVPLLREKKFHSYSVAPSLWARYCR
jgi:hypothetical protein